MAISLRQQSAKVQGTGSAPLSVNFSFGSLPIVGNTIIITVFGWTSVGSPGYTVTDNQGNTYTGHIVNTTAAGGEVKILSAPVNTSAGTFTVTVKNNGSGASTVNFNAQEWSGLAATPFDQASTTNGTSTTPSTGTTATTMQANELLVGGNKDDSNTGTWSANAAGSTPSSGWALEINETDDSNFGAGATADVIVSATGTYVHVWSQTGVSSAWVGCIATFKATVAAAAPAGFDGRVLRSRLREW